MFARLLRFFLGKRSSPLADLHAPLSETELQTLADELARLQPHEGHLADIHALDGYLACIAVGPRTVGPGEWITWMFKDKIPNGYLIQLAVRRMSTIADECTQQPPRYRPLLETHPHLRGQLAPLDAWCQGFMTASVLCDEEWEELLQDASIARWLHPIWSRANAADQGPHRSERRADRKAGQAVSWNAQPLRAAVLKIRSHCPG